MRLSPFRFPTHTYNGPAGCDPTTAGGYFYGFGPISWESVTVNAWKALSALAVLVWLFAAGPVLFRSRVLAAALHRSCWYYPSCEIGIPVLTPFRSRTLERIADASRRAASGGRCLPEWSRRMCEFVTQRPLPAQSWCLVDWWRSAGDLLLADRLGSAQEVALVYRLYSRELAKRGRNGCLFATVRLRRAGGTWKVSGYGVEPASQDVRCGP